MIYQLIYVPFDELEPAGQEGGDRVERKVEDLPPIFVAGFPDNGASPEHISGRKDRGVATFSFLEVKVNGSVLRRRKAILRIARTRVFLVIVTGAYDESEGPEIPFGAELAAARVYVDGIAVGEGPFVSKGAHVIFS